MYLTFSSLLQLIKPSHLKTMAIYTDNDNFVPVLSISLVCQKSSSTRSPHLIQPFDRVCWRTGGVSHKFLFFIFNIHSVWQMHWIQEQFQRLPNKLLSEISSKGMCFLPFDSHFSIQFSSSSFFSPSSHGFQAPNPLQTHSVLLLYIHLLDLSCAGS